MDYRDTDKVYEERRMRKADRLIRRQQHAQDTRNIIATGFSLALVFVMTVIMVTQLASCSAPPKVDEYEQHKIAWKEYMSKTDLRGTPYSDLLDMWDTVWIEAMINNEKTNTY